MAKARAKDRRRFKRLGEHRTAEPFIARHSQHDDLSHGTVLEGCPTEIRGSG